MKISQIKIIIPFLLLAICFFIQKNISLPTIKVSKQETALNVDNNFLKFAVSPFTLLVTDLFWITTLMESDLDHYKEKDLNSWIFLRFKAITELDPNFLKAYQFGGQYLNIIKDDLEGSSYIFERGLEVFPDNYELISNAAFLYAFEYENTERAIELYSKAITFPQAPEYFGSILSKLKYSENQDPKLAFLYLKEIYDDSPSSLFKEKLKSDLYTLKAIIDLKCLNSEASKGCDTLDFFETPYIYENGEFKTKAPIPDFKIFRRSSQP